MLVFSLEHFLVLMEHEQVNAGSKTIHVGYEGPKPWDNPAMEIKPATMVADQY